MPDFPKGQRYKSFDALRAAQESPKPRAPTKQELYKQKQREAKTLRIQMGDSIGLLDLSELLNKKATDVLKLLWTDDHTGINLNSMLTFEQVSAVAKRLGYDEVERTS